MHWLELAPNCRSDRRRQVNQLVDPKKKTLRIIIIYNNDMNALILLGSLACVVLASGWIFRP